jgi:hypothetical protein
VPALFVSGFQNANKNYFCLLVFEGTLKSVIKDKKTKRSYKTVDIMVFLAFFA